MDSLGADQQHLGSKTIYTSVKGIKKDTEEKKTPSFIKTKSKRVLELYPKSRGKTQLSYTGRR